MRCSLGGLTAHLFAHGRLPVFWRGTQVGFVTKVFLPPANRTATSPCALGVSVMPGTGSGETHEKDSLRKHDVLHSLDAMGCQKDIAERIVSSGADYVFGLKSNHADLHEDVKFYFENEKGSDQAVTKA